jgi:hypothetical protein
MKKLLLIILFSGSLVCFAQQDKINDLFLKTPQIIYLGIDFSHGQLIHVRDKERKLLRDDIFQKMNMKFLSERIEYLQEKLSKQIYYSENQIRSMNSKFSDFPLMINNDSISRILSVDSINSKTGTGLIFFVTRLDDKRNEVEICGVFFDLETRKVIWMDKEEGRAQGGPSRGMSSWYPRIERAINSFISAYKDQKGELKEHARNKDTKSKSNNFFVKVLVDEGCFGYERVIIPGLNFSVEAGYRPNYGNSWTYTSNPSGIEYIYRFACFSGFTVRFDLKYKVSRRSYLGFAIGYQQLYCPKVTWDPGGYGGDDDTEYDVWKERNQEIVLQALQFINIGRPHSPVQFFYGIGGKICNITEYYISEGERYHHIPSEKVIVATKFQPLFTFGLNIRLVSF